MPDEVSRRQFVALLSAGSGLALAGCSTAPDTAVETDPDILENSDSGRTITEATVQPPESGVDTSRFTDVYRVVKDSVAQIQVTSLSGTSQGTGWMYDDSGHIVTNEHVVGGAGEVAVRFPTGEWSSATVIGTDVYSDLAVLGLDDPPESATPLALQTRDPPVGEEVLAIGNPFGFSGSVSSGIVSGLNRTLPATPGSDFTIPDAIQTDAPVNPGNSGGPLVDLQGEVIGVINSGGGDNIGFAISGALTSRVAPALVEEGEYKHSYMGIRLQPVTPSVAEANDLAEASGVYVHEVLDDGPSGGVLQGTDRTEGGVRVGGDIIRRMGGQQIRTDQDLSNFLALQTSPGDTIEIVIIRDGGRETVMLTLGERPPPSEN